MSYQIELRPEALRDLKALDKFDMTRVCATGYRLGLLINFGQPKLELKSIVK
jgi:hypothetical protein